MYTHDIEAMGSKLVECKKQLNTYRMANVQLNTSILQLKKEIENNEKVIEHFLAKHENEKAPATAST